MGAGCPVLGVCASEYLSCEWISDRLNSRRHIHRILPAPVPGDNMRANPTDRLPDSPDIPLIMIEARSLTMSVRQQKVRPTCCYYALFIKG
jgi:hypothetical protein